MSKLKVHVVEISDQFRQFFLYFVIYQQNILQLKVLTTLGLISMS